MNEVLDMAPAQTAVATQQPRAVAAASSSAVAPADLLRYALENGADLDRLEKLMELQQRYEENEARKAYVNAMAEFKLNPPQIVKDKLVQFSGTSYTHATLGNVTSAIVEGLAKHGFSHRWDTEQQGANVSVTCTITHRKGHSERTTLSAAKDDSGKKNNIQQMASAITYLQRYTLLAATGLATHDQVDDDGASAELDTRLADNWIARVNAAPTDADVLKVWELGIVAIQAANDRHAYKEFKDAVAARRAALAGAAA
ncbi:MAG: ERF family protein [Pseudomonadota bacterium]